MLWIHSFCTRRLVSYSGYMHLHVQSHAHGMHVHKPCWECSGTCNSCTVLAWDAEELHARAAGGKANSVLPAGGCADDNSVTGGRLPSWLGKRLRRPELAPKQSQWLPTCLRVWVTWVWSQRGAREKGSAVVVFLLIKRYSFLAWTTAYEKQSEKQKPVFSGKQELLNCLLPLNVSVILFTHFSDIHQKARGIWCQGFQENLREKNLNPGNFTSTDLSFFFRLRAATIHF